MTTFKTHFLSSLHNTVLLHWFKTNDHHIVNWANLCALVVFTTIPLPPTTAKALSSFSVASVSLHKNELSFSTLAPDHIATEFSP
ncbi:hypothetical protein J6T66_02290 [bacterium]|nr:hypothetical protein [bacterium]